MAIEAARLFVKVGSDTREGERGLLSFNDRLNQSARNLTMTGGIMTAGLTLPLLAVGKSALDMAGDYEQSMNVLQQVTGASAEVMSALNAQALTLGAETVFSAGEAANAMLELGKAGMSTEQIMAAIPGVMDLAAAGGVGLAEAASLTAATLNAFHLEASESARVADLLAAAANASAADIADLGAGMQQAGFAFALANQPVENLAASLAILTNVGLTGSDAGTALKNAFMRMMNPTVEATAAMQELGISFYDAQGAMLGLPEIIDILNSATEGLTDQQRDQALATIFLSDGMKALIPLMDAGSEGFNAMVDTVTEAGAATEVANARMAGLKGGMEELRGSVESFLIGAAQPFLGTLGNLARAAGDAITWFGALPQPVINASLAFAGILAAAGPAITGLGLLAGAVGFLISPLGLLVAASAALAAAWVADFGGIQGITATAMSNAQGWFDSTLASAQNLATGISTAFANTSFPSLETLWQQFQAGDFQAVANTIRNTAFELMVNLDTELNITANANALKGKLVEAVNSLGTAVSNLDFSGAQANLNSMRDGILSGISTAIEGVDWGQGGNAFAGMITDLTASVNNLDFSEINWAEVFKRALLGPAGLALAGIQWVMDSSEFDGLKTSVQGAIGQIDWGELGGSFTGLGTAIGTQLGAIFTDMGSDILAEIPPIDVDWGQLAINAVGLVDSVTTSINGVDWVSVGESAGSALLGAVKLSFGAVDWLAETKTSITTAALGLATNIGFEIGTALRGINILEALGQLEGSIKAAFVKMMLGVGSQIGSELNFMLDLPPIDWAAVIEVFSWTDYITSFDWGTYIRSLSWDDYLAALEWANFVFGLDWGSFVVSLSWSSFVPDISWGSFIPSIDWGSFVGFLDWGRFIPRLFGGGSEPAANAAGTSYFEGGMTWVGERGPELVRLPRGSRIFNNRESMSLAMGNGIHITIENLNISSDMDIHASAAKLAREVRKRLR